MTLTNFALRLSFCYTVSEMSVVHFCKRNALAYGQQKQKCTANVKQFLLPTFTTISCEMYCSDFLSLELTVFKLRLEYMYQPNVLINQFFNFVLITTEILI